VRRRCVGPSHTRPHALRAFVVTEAKAEAIRAAFNQNGAFAAAVEVRRGLQASPTDAFGNR